MNNVKNLTYEGSKNLMCLTDITDTEMKIKQMISNDI